MNSIISKFYELPKISKTWRIFYYGFSVILVIVLIKLIYLIPLNPMRQIGASMGEFYWPNLVGPTMFLIQLIFLIYSIKIGINSYKKGERSWILWVGFLHIAIIILLGLSYFNFIPNIF